MGAWHVLFVCRCGLMVMMRGFHPSRSGFKSLRRLIGFGFGFGFGVFMLYIYHCHGDGASVVQWLSIPLC